MKRLVLALFFITLTSCYVSPTKETEQNNCGGNSRCMNPTNMKFKTQAGYENVSWDDIQSVTVSMPTGPGEFSQPLEKTFTGREAIWVVSAFSFFNPKEGSIPNSVQTGTVVLRYGDVTATHMRIFSIQNGRLIQDKSFPMMIYMPATVLDLDWLKRQPEAPSGS